MRVDIDNRTAEFGIQIQDIGDYELLYASLDHYRELVGRRQRKAIAAVAIRAIDTSGEPGERPTPEMRLERSDSVLALRAIESYVQEAMSEPILDQAECRQLARGISALEAANSVACGSIAFEYPSVAPGSVGAIL